MAETATDPRVALLSSPAAIPALPHGNTGARELGGTCRATHLPRCSRCRSVMSYSPLVQPCCCPRLLRSNAHPGSGWPWLALPRHLVLPRTAAVPLLAIGHMAASIVTQQRSCSTGNANCLATSSPLHLTTTLDPGGAGSFRLASRVSRLFRGSSLEVCRAEGAARSHTRSPFAPSVSAAGSFLQLLPTPQNLAIKTPSPRPQLHRKRNNSGCRPARRVHLRWIANIRPKPPCALEEHSPTPTTKMPIVRRRAPEKMASGPAKDSGGRCLYRKHNGFPSSQPARQWDIFSSSRT